MENFEVVYLANTLFQTQEFGRPNMSFQTQEFRSDHAAHEVGSAAGTVAAYYDSSASDRTQTALASRNKALERSRREKLNQKLCALRAAVPIITKLDKASIIKDAIEYIQLLHEQERTIQAEISELENKMPSNGQSFVFDQDAATFCYRPNTSKMDQFPHNSAGSTIISSPIEGFQLNVLNMGEKTVLSLACDKGTDTIIKLCEIFESLKLKITTANITAVSGRILKTVFLEADDEERKVIRAKIEGAIAALSYPHSPMSISK